MAKVPANPKIYHITHLRNLPQIISAGKLWSDAKRIELGFNCDVVGLSHIKQRRLKEIEVDCHPGTFVGEYVPFYFCPRSIMLFILHKGNSPDLDYSGGQQPIIHLQADLNAVVTWANDRGRRWAFSDRNAGGYLIKCRNELGQLNVLNWSAIEATNWGSSTVKEGKQAEFLLFKSFPWELIEHIGVIDAHQRKSVRTAIQGANHQPVVSVRRDWYY